jgi:hypothetical protein
MEGNPARPKSGIPHFSRQAVQCSFGSIDSRQRILAGYASTGAGWCEGCPTKVLKGYSDIRIICSKPEQQMKRINTPMGLYKMGVYIQFIIYIYIWYLYIYII